MTVYTNENIVKKLFLFHNQHFNQTMSSSAGYNQAMAASTELAPQFAGVHGGTQWNEENHRMLLEEVERISSPPSPLPPKPFFLNGNFDTPAYEENKVNELVKSLDKIILNRSTEAFLNTKYEI